MYYDITASWMIFRVRMHKLYFLQGLLGSLLFTHSLSPSYLHLCSFLSYCWIVLPSCGLMAVCFYDWGGGWRVLSLFITQSCPTLCHPTDCSTPGFPVLHHLLELAQTHVHWVGDAIQPACPLLSSSQSFPASGYLPMSQLFASGGQSIGASASASVPPVNIQDWFRYGVGISPL